MLRQGNFAHFWGHRRGVDLMRLRRLWGRARAPITECTLALVCGDGGMRDGF
jgi:hypothetical protein